MPVGFVVAMATKQQVVEHEISYFLTQPLSRSEVGSEMDSSENAA